jgi:hypothetical protein
MIIAVCIAAAHDHDRYVAYVQPAAMQGGEFVVLDYAKLRVRGRPAMPTVHGVPVLRRS